MTSHVRVRGEGELARNKKLAKGLDRMPSGKIRARVYFEDRQLSIGTFATERDAKAALLIARSEIARQTFIPPADKRAARKVAQQRDKATKVTVKDAAKQWLTWVEDNRARGTWKTYVDLVNNHITPTLGDMALSAVTPNVVEEWRDALIEEAGASIPSHAYQALKTMFTWCTGRAKGQSTTFTPLTTENPCTLPPVKRKRRPKDITIATPEQVDQLAGTIMKARRVAVLLGAHNALRAGEVCGLKRGDFTESDGILWLHVQRQVQARDSVPYIADLKTPAADREIPVAAAIRKDVDALLKGKHKGEMIFTGAGGGLLSPGVLETSFVRARERRDKAHPGDQLGKGFSFHTLRHRGLTTLGQNGATLAELATFAGHSDVNSVMIYQHSTKARLAALVAE